MFHSLCMPYLFVSTLPTNHTPVFVVVFFLSGVCVCIMSSSSSSSSSSVIVPYLMDIRTKKAVIKLFFLVM